MSNPTKLPESLSGRRPAVGVVLGSGLGSFVDHVSVDAEVSYADLDSVPTSKVPGHAGRLVCGKIGETEVVVAQGRVHLYEGHSAYDVAALVRVMAAMGVETLVLTNAAGLVNESFSTGHWMQISDHLNLTGTTPLLGGANFFDMSEVYSAELRGRFSDLAKARGMTLFEGVYAGNLGPQYETPAEVRMARTLGADAVGMSTVLEAIQARALGLRVAGFSCLTNWGAGIGKVALDHEDVLDVGQRAAGDLVGLLGDYFGG